ncbi:hypothetical protein NPIL_369341 [Nephila pilipes]|uniref:Uncharacterized protein n=1 Tax=Nephila pilipes TaxID=299642 RepID=A0A8X6R3Y8_NEPPI|nr:hypothetical protein NPIL_369341 [Nephila pilipes]
MVSTTLLYVCRSVFPFFLILFCPLLTFPTTYSNHLSMYTIAPRSGMYVLSISPESILLSRVEGGISTKVRKALLAVESVLCYWFGRRPHKRRALLLLLLRNIVVSRENS